MATLTTLAKIKSIARDDAAIQALTGTEDEVVNILADLALLVPESKFRSYTEIAQRYLGAHLLSMANQPSGGRGPVSSYSIGGITRSYTLPYLNRKEVFGATQYGMDFLQILDKVALPFDVLVSS